MPVNYQTVAYPLVGGLDTKIAGIALPPPRLQRVENCWIERTGALRKRRGFTAMGTSTMSGGSMGTALAALATYKDQLLAFSKPNSGTQPTGYEYSATEGRWVDKGIATSMKVTTTGVAKSDTEDSFSADKASSNGVTVYAYTGDNGTTAPIKITVMDAAGTIIVASQQLVADGRSPRVVALSSRIYVFYYDTAAADIKVFIIDPTSATTLTSSLAGAAVQVVNDMAIVGGGALYDVAKSGANGVLFVYRTNAATTIKWGFVDNAGAFANTKAVATVANAVAVTCAVDSANFRHGFVYTTATTPADLYARIESFSAGVWTMVVTSGAIEGALGAVISVVACKWNSTDTTVQIWWSGDAAVTTSTGFNDKLVTASYSRTGTAAGSVSTLRHSRVASKPFRIGNDDYIVVLCGDSFGLQDTFYVVRRSDTEIVAHVLPQLGYQIPLYNNVTQVEVSGDVASWAAQYKRTLRQGSSTIFGGKVGVKGIALSITHDQSHASEQAGECLYLAGGFMQEYDGQSFVEASFLRFVETSQITLTPAGGGSMAPNKAYSYHVIPEWTNARGERKRGTNSGAKTITAATMGANTKVTLSIPTISHTRMKSSGRTNLVFGIYRTTQDTGVDAAFYRIGQVANDATIDEVSYVDTKADASIITGEYFYEISGELKNMAPPPGHIMCSGGGRIFLAGVDDPSQIWASKLRFPGDSIAFNGALLIQVPDEGGPITALAFLNGTLVVFKRDRIYLVRGDGPNNTNSGGEFFTPELIASDSGAVGQRGVVLTPMGLVFQSAKGIYLLTQNFQLEYIGAPLEGLGALTPALSAVLVPLDQQVRFAFAAGTYVYDYFHKQWYVFTTISSGPCALWADTYLSFFGTGIFQESAAVFTDDGSAYSMLLRLAWMHTPASLQGDLHIRRVGLVGESKAAHNLRVKLARDLSSTVVQTITAAPTGAGPLIRQWRVVRGVVADLQVEIDDNSSTTESMTLSEVTFELGVRTAGPTSRAAA